MHHLNSEPAEDIRYRHGELEFTIRADVPGIMQWLAPDPVTGQLKALTEETFEAFLAHVVSDEDGEKIAAAIEAGTFGEKARFDAAMAGWRNSTRLADFAPLSAKIEGLKKLADTLTAEVTTSLERVKADEGKEEQDPLED